MNLKNFLLSESNKDLIKLFPLINSSDFAESERIIIDGEIEDYSENTNQIVSVIHLEHRRYIRIIITRVSKKEVSVKCECGSIYNNKLCPHVIAVWFVYNHYDLKQKIISEFDNDPLVEYENYDDEIEDDEFDDLHPMKYDSFFSSLLNGVMGSFSGSSRGRHISSLFKSHESWYYNDLIYYNPTIYYTDETSLKSEESNKIATWYDKLDSSIKLSYYFLLSDTDFKKNVFRKHYYKFFSYFFEGQEKQEYIKFLKNTRGVSNTNKIIKINDKKLGSYLISNFNPFIEELKTGNRNYIGLSDDLKPMKPIADLISLINYIVNIYNSSGKIFTKKDEILMSVSKKILHDLPSYVSGKLEKHQYLYLIEFVTYIIIICDFIEFDDERQVKLTNTYFQFLSSETVDQKSFIYGSYIDIIKNHDLDDDKLDEIYEDHDLDLRPDYPFDNILNFLHKILFSKIYDQSLADVESENSDKILQLEILMSFYKRDLEVANTDGTDGAFDIDSFQLLNIDKNFRPKTKIMRLPYPTIYDATLNYLQFELFLLDVVIPLVNSKGKVMGYQITNRNLTTEIPQNKITNVTKKALNDIITILPDFTIKGDSKSFNTDNIQWLVNYTQTTKLDNFIEAKLTKEKLWEYLDSNIDHSLDSYLSKLDFISSNPIPENVLSSLKAWSSQFGFVQVIDGVTITIPEPGLIDSFTSSKTLQNIKIIRLSPNIISFPKIHKDKITKFISKQGYHVKQVSL